MTMRSIIAEDAPSALPIGALGPHPRLDRVAAASSEQLSTALTFMSVFDPDAFDHAMDVAESADENPGATGEAEPVCAICSASIGIFLERGLNWLHYAGDGTTAGAQHIYDPGHTPVVTWLLSEDLQTQ
jgi:hypothetical protein